MSDRDDRHIRCQEPGCWFRCQRPGCLTPSWHLMQHFYPGIGYQHDFFDCTAPRPSLLPAPAPRSRRRAAPPPSTTGPSPPRPPHGPVVSLPPAEVDAWLPNLTGVTGERWFAYNRDRVLDYISFRVRKGGFRPAPIARSMACRDLAISPKTWARLTRWLLSEGWIWRDTRPGRLSNRASKNQGSLYLVNWKRVALAWVAISKSSHPERKSGHLARLLNTEIESWSGETGSLFRSGNGVKMDGNRPTDGSGAATVRPIRSGATVTGRTQSGTVPTPLPPPPGGGNGQLERGDPVPPAIAQQVRSALRSTRVRE